MKNKVALITGSAGGIGGALVNKLMELGVTCIQTDLDTHGEGIDADLSNLNGLLILFNKIESKKIDYLFNVAGVSTYGTMEALTTNNLEHALNINVIAPYTISKLLMPKLLRSEDPRIINIGSVMGLEPTPGRTVYCTTKFALRGMTLSLAKELKGRVKVSLISLGSVLNDFGDGIRKRRKLKEAGKKYFSNDEVAERIMVEVVTIDKPKMEYVWRPEDIKYDVNPSATDLSWTIKKHTKK